MERIVQDNPEDANLRLSLALMYYEASRYDDALSQLTIAVELNDTHNGAYIAMGEIYLELNNYQEALNAYARVVEINKDNPMAEFSATLQTVYYQIGFCNINLGQPDEAIQNLERSLEINRLDSDAWYLLGVAYKDNENYEKALEAFSEAVRFIPDYIEAYEALSECYLLTGQENLSQYADAMAEYSAGNYDTAIEYLENLILSVTDFADAYLGLGLSYEGQGLIEQAIDAYQRALDINPDIWMAQTRLQALGGLE